MAGGVARSVLLCSTMFYKINTDFTVQEYHSLSLVDHIYRMVIVEGRCSMARSSSLGANCSLVDTKV